MTRPAVWWLGTTLLGREPGRGETAALFLEATKKAYFAELERLRRQGCQDRLPVDPVALAPLRAVSRIERVPLEVDGLLVPTEQGFTMRLNSSTTEVHQRLVCAHELAHTYFYNVAKRPPERGYRKGPLDYWVEEGLAFEGARRVLMPQERMIEFLRDNPTPRATAILAGMRRFRVSARVLALRIQETCRWSAAFVFLTKSGDSIRVVETLKSAIPTRLTFGCRGAIVEDPTLRGLYEATLRRPDRLAEWDTADIELGTFKGSVRNPSGLVTADEEGRVLLILPFEPTG